MGEVIDLRQEGGHQHADDRPDHAVYPGTSDLRPGVRASRMEILTATHVGAGLYALVPRICQPLLTEPVGPLVEHHSCLSFGTLS